MTRIVILPTQVEPIPRPSFNPPVSKGFAAFQTTLTVSSGDFTGIANGTLILCNVAWNSANPITVNAAVTADWTQLYNLSVTNALPSGKVQAGVWARVRDGSEEGSSPYSWSSTSGVAGLRFLYWGPGDHGVSNPATDLTTTTDQSNSNTVTYPAVDLSSAGGIVMRFSNFYYGSVVGVLPWPPAGNSPELQTAPNGALGFYHASVNDQTAGTKPAGPFSLTTAPGGQAKSSISASVAIPR